MTGNSLRNRLTRGLGAQGFSQAVQILIRLAEVPVLLGLWRLQLYGEWLMLAAVPEYLALVDIGFTGAAIHEMTMRAGADDRDGALSVFRSTWVLVTGISLLLGAVFIAAILTLPFGGWLHFQAMSAATSRMVLLLLVLSVFVGFQSGLLNGAFWCEGRYDLGMSLLALGRLLQFGGTVAGAFLGGPQGAALGFFGGRAVGTVAMRLYLYRAVPWVRFGFAKVRRSEIRRLVRPALASFALPLGNAFNIQSVRLVVGTVLGPAAVAVFASFRTLSQLPLLPNNIVAQLLEPEMALAYGKGDKHLLGKLFRRSSQLTLWSTLVSCAVTAVLASAILRVWTRGELRMNWMLFGPLLVAAAVDGLWCYVPLMLAYATNRHGRISVAYSAIYGVGTMLLAYLGARTAGFLGVGIGVLATELAMAAYVIPAAVKMSEEEMGAWLRSVLPPPWWVVRRLRRYNLS